MPIYENRQNAENIVSLSPASLAMINSGFTNVIKSIAAGASAKSSTVLLLDGWYGIDWKKIIPAMQQAMPGAKMISASGIFHDAAKLAELKAEWITEDPCFGKVNNVGTIDDFIVPEKITALENSVSGLTVIYGPGALKCFNGRSDIFRVYFDMTADPMLW